MQSSKLILLAILYLLGAPIADAGTSSTCVAGTACAGTMKCVTLKTDNVCIEPCDDTKVTEQCGPGATCGSINDIDNNPTKTCATAKGCLADTDCNTADPAKPICNTYTLKCEAAAAAITTTESTTTAEAAITTAPQVVPAPVEKCEDKVTGGPNDCASLAAYCTDKLYLDLMKTKCPKTCGYCTNNNGNSSGGSGTSGCRNLLSDCSNKLYLCKNTIYKDFMKKNCPASCGYC